MLAHLLVLCTRVLMVLLFFPFSAMDKVINFSSALTQAREQAPGRLSAALLIAAGLGVEALMSLGVLTGIADSACAVVLALYCVVTAVLWKPFWRQADFRLSGPSQGREVFWDFLKNLSVAGGFLMLALGPNAATVNQFLAAPFASHDLYGLATRGAP